MLVLERTPSSAILIGSEVRIEVLRTGSNRVLLGIQAPRNIAIRRAELPPLEQHHSNLKMEQRANRASTNGDASGSFNVLVVEDDPDRAALIRRAIEERHQSQVVITSSAESALQKLADVEQTRLNLVLLDLNLPGLSGADFICALRAMPALKETPVVVLSGSNDANEIQECLSAGANAFVAKDSDPGALRRSILCIADFWQHVCRVA